MVVSKHIACTIASIALEMNRARSVLVTPTRALTNGAVRSVRMARHKMPYDIQGVEI